MIAIIEELPGDLIGVRARGEITAEEASAFVEGYVEQLIADRSELRLLVHLGPEFTGFGGGEWAELTARLLKVPFVRGALVSDDFALTTAVTAMKWTLAGQVRTYRNDQFDRAVTWVAG